MGTAIKHPMPVRIKPSFVIFDIRALCSESDSSGVNLTDVLFRLDCCTTVLV